MLNEEKSVLSLNTGLYEFLWYLAQETRFQSFRSGVYRIFKKKFEGINVNFLFQHLLWFVWFLPVIFWTMRLWITLWVETHKQKLDIKHFSSDDADKQFAADSDNHTVLVESITKTVVKLQYNNTVSWWQI